MLPREEATASAALATSTAAEGIEFSVGQLSLSGKRIRVNAAKSKGSTNTTTHAYIMLGIFILYMLVGIVYIRERYS